MTYAMIEIGQKKTRVKKTRLRGKLVPLLDDHKQPVTELVAAEVSRVTRGVLDGQFGRDKRRKLVVTLRDGDLLELRPQGTRQASRLSLFDIYRMMLRHEANVRQLEKARKRKTQRQLQALDRKHKRMFRKR